MKKVFWAVLALSVLSFSSCKKTYTCDCEYLLIMGGGGSAVDGGKTTTKKYKNEAEAAADCQAQEDEINAPENQSGSCVLIPG